MRSKLIALMLCACAWMALAPQPAAACPNCKTALEQDDAKPKAYMYSILFMLAMPATLFSAFGIGLYRLSRRQEFETLASLDGESGPPQE